MQGHITMVIIEMLYGCGLHSVTLW